MNTKLCFKSKIILIVTYALAAIAALVGFLTVTLIDNTSLVSKNNVVTLDPNYTQQYYNVNNVDKAMFKISPNNGGVYSISLEATEGFTIYILSANSKDALSTPAKQSFSTQISSINTSSFTAEFDNYSTYYIYAEFNDKCNAKIVLSKLY